MERTRPIFDAEPEITQDRASPGVLGGGIEMANIRFRYAEDVPPILENFSLRIEPGEFVALVGPSGSGKSTILRLLLGFENPESGTVFFDGKDLQTLDLREARRQIGVVLQSNSLIPGDIFRNIVGESSLTLDDAWRAAEMAGLADDIRAMPMQMHTVISEGGAGFSGGQKQRLAIARALAHSPRLLFFDEATSALDNRTQAIVTASLEKLNATRLVIAHRLSTIIQADRIVVLRNGRVVEDGTYEKLMAERGFFHELASRQLASGEADE
jgi:ATP-binding cassette subfamily C protein